MFLGVLCLCSYGGHATEDCLHGKISSTCLSERNLSEVRDLFLVKIEAESLISYWGFTVLRHDRTES